jgi:hypothetical protein
MELIMRIMWDICVAISLIWCIVLLNTAIHEPLLREHVPGALISVGAIGLGYYLRFRQQS